MGDGDREQARIRNKWEDWQRETEGERAEKSGKVHGSCC